MHPQQEKWNRRYRNCDANSASDGQPLLAAQVLRDYLHLLPMHVFLENGKLSVKDKALDLACGRGANALLLAQQGLQVSAWDIADVALQQLQHTAAQQQLLIETQQRDVLQSPPQPGSFDVIVVSYFLERSLFPIFQAALNPQGLLFYQTFTAEKCVEQGPNNPDYLLAPNELLQLCAGMRVLAYREEGRVGDCSQGLRNESMIVAQRL